MPGSTVRSPTPQRLLPTWLDRMTTEIIELLAIGDIRPDKEIHMYAKNTSSHLIFGVASVLSKAVTLGSVLALADHYSGASLWALANSVSVAQP